MKGYLIIVILILALSGCSTQQGQNQSDWKVATKTNWADNEGLLSIESIVLDENNDILYASNGLQYKPGTDGFISKLSKRGDILDLKWIDSLNRPTGMAIHQAILYVADVNALLLIDTHSGTITQRIASPIANAGLNDVSINAQGEVFVSASFIHAILKLENGKLVQWLQDKEKLQWANGISAEDDKLLVGGMNLVTVDLKSKAINTLSLNPSVQDFDGIVSDRKGGYFLTTVANSGLYHFNGATETRKLMEGQAYFGDLDFDPNSNTLYLPRGNNETSEYYITEVNLEDQN